MVTLSERLQPTQVAVLRVTPQTVTASHRAIAHAAGLSPHSAAAALKLLGDKGLVNRTPSGRYYRTETPWRLAVPRTTSPATA